MSQPDGGWFERDGIGLHYLEWNSDAPGPAIVLLHGLSSNARYWDRVALHLPGRRLVALDQRGHGLTGRSSRPPVPGGYEMSELIGDVRALTEKLALFDPVIVGHSWGAAVALEAVASEPAFASGLVFIDGPIQNLNRVFSWNDAQGMMQPPLPRYRSMADAIADSKSDFREAWGPDLESFVEARVMSDGPDLVLTLTAPVRLELLRGLYASQPETLWPRVHVPALVLLAMQTYPGIARSVEQGVKRLQETAPHVATTRLDSPHDIPLYLPAEVASEIDRIASAATDVVPT